MIPFFKYFKTSFQAKVFLTAISLIFATAMSLNYFFFTNQKHELLLHLTNHSESLARILAHESRIGAFTEEEKDLLPPAKMILADQYCQRVIIYDPSGQTLAEVTRENFTHHPPHMLPPEEIFAHIPSAPPSWPASYSTSDNIIIFAPIYATAPFSNDDLFFDNTPQDEHQEETASQAPLKPIGYATLIMTTSGIKEKAKAFMLYCSLVTLTISMISSCLIFLFLRIIIRPLALLATEVSQHHLATAKERADKNRTTLDLEEMITVIREAFVTVNTLKDNLEKQVKIRTGELEASNKNLYTQKESLKNANLRLKKTLDKLHQIQDQLIQSEKMAALGLVFSGLSHEINNAVNFITGALPILENNLTIIKNIYTQNSNGNEPETSKFHKAEANTDILIANIREGVRRIIALIGDLKIFSYNRPELSLTDIHLGLAASISILRHEYKERVLFTEEYAPDMPTIMSQGGQLNQVFMNILLNAAQSFDGAGTVKVKTWSTDTHVHIAISDNGSGIKAEVISRIFDPFFTTKEVGKGNGLGLSVSYSVIRNLGGEIKVDSTPEKGSLFEVVLPRQYASSGDTLID